MHRDPWTVPSGPTPCVPPGHPDSNYPCWLSPTTFKPSAGATSDHAYLVKHVASDCILVTEILEIYGVHIVALTEAIKLSGVQRKKDRSLLRLDVEQHIAPLLPPKGFLPLKEARRIIGYTSQRKKVDSELSFADFLVGNLRFYDPNRVIEISKRVDETRRELKKEAAALRHERSKESQRIRRGYCPAGCVTRAKALELLHCKPQTLLTSGIRQVRMLSRVYYDEGEVLAWAEKRRIQ